MNQKYTALQVFSHLSPISRYGWGIPGALLAITLTSGELATLAQNLHPQIIHVNVQTGDDRAGNGSEKAPWKTLTRALEVARSPTTILLAPGTYSTATGEKFPLLLTTNISIEGNPYNQGRKIIIQGNGTFTSPTSANQQVTIVANDKAGSLSGVTVINPHSRGYGLWIESASPKITHNSFIRSGNGGISVNGESAPLIANNYIYNNLGNGIVVYGRSRPQIANNEIAKTGFGVSVLQEAEVTLKNNQIIGNRVGLVVEGEAQAILRQNTIELSSEDGIVTMSNAFTDLGTAQEPGNNIFRSNRHTDIKNLAPLQIIPAAGNQISGATTGRIDFTGTTNRFIPVANQPEPASLPPLPPPPAQRAITVNTSASVPRSTPGNSPQPIPAANPSPQPISPPPLPQTTITNAKTDREGLLDLLFVAPSKGSSINSQPTFPAERLSVPETEELAEKVPLALNPGYRVVAETLNPSQVEKVRSLYPDAFTTIYNGQSVWQVGVFQNRARAEQVRETLNERGISALIIRL